MGSTQPTFTPPPLSAPFANSSSPPILLTLGAEAHLYITNFLSPTHKAVLKYRPSKSYRHPILDARLTKHRILSEARILVKCKREGVNVPGVLALDVGNVAKGGGGWMMMEWIQGGTVRARLQEGERWLNKTALLRENADSGADAGNEFREERERYERQKQELMEKIGRAVGKLHEIGVVHGDLTTSNLMLRGPCVFTNGTAMTNRGSASAATDDPGISLKGEVVLIDFGLAAQNIQDEDKAVDLYVLERAFGSTHPEAEGGFQEVLRAYGDSYRGAKMVLRKLEDVRMRGRKRSMVG
ncbi:MAG: hypothetical protein Q9190_003539 [Brigantiaea leucoxantha]